MNFPSPPTSCPHLHPKNMRSAVRGDKAACFTACLPTCLENHQVKDYLNLVVNWARSRPAAEIIDGQLHEATVICGHMLNAFTCKLSNYQVEKEAGSPHTRLTQEDYLEGEIGQM